MLSPAGLIWLNLPIRAKSVVVLLSSSLERENHEMKEEMKKKAEVTAGPGMDSVMATLRRYDARMVDIEQHSRKGNIRIHGLDEDEREDTLVKVVNFISSKVNVKITKQDVVAAHRLPSERSPRPVIVRFARRETLDHACRGCTTA